jgi:hypothetical protein
MYVNFHRVQVKSMWSPGSPGEVYVESRESRWSSVDSRWTPLPNLKNIDSYHIPCGLQVESMEFKWTMWSPGGLYGGGDCTNSINSSGGVICDPTDEILVSAG